VTTCPEDSCTVDITPRHCRNFKPTRGRQFKWTNTSLADLPARQAGNNVIGSGTVIADQWGLVTVKAVRVGKGGNRISIQPR
jgi:hypothetical protein